jgi:hypothetical protein
MTLPKVRYVALEMAQDRLTSRLTRIKGAYKLGNITKQEALKQSENAFLECFKEVMKFTEQTTVTRDLGPHHKQLKSQQLGALKREVKRKQLDFQKVLEDAQ